jgi:hypothetical protein
MLICVEEMRHAYKILVVKLEGKRLLGRLRNRWNNLERMLGGHRIILNVMLLPK